MASRPPTGTEAPVGVEVLPTLLLQLARAPLQVQHVARPVHAAASAGPSPPARHVVGQRRPDREQRVGIGAEEAIAHLRPEDRVAVRRVLDRPQAVQVLGVDHERRVGRVDHLVGRQQLLADEPHHVHLRAGVQAQAGLVEQDDVVVVRCRAGRARATRGTRRTR